MQVLACHHGLDGVVRMWINWVCDRDEFQHYVTDYLQCIMKFWVSIPETKCLDKQN